MVESQPSKLLVAGSIPVSRSSLRRQKLFGGSGWASQSVAANDRREAGRPAISHRVRSYGGQAGCLVQPKPEGQRLM